jgi:ATP-dependent helicase HrpA
MCLELGRGVAGLIGHTQPRRIAARSIAERVAEELGSEVGILVGYSIRFTDRVGERTLVKVMTDGILLAEIQRDPSLRRYDTIIVDEAHERSLNVDFLLGYLHRLLPRRPDLKLIITSATIDTERFSEHFGNAPVVEVSGRAYPVEVRYRPLDDPSLAEPRDQPQGIADAVAELTGEGNGDILVFCSGEREIRDAAEALAELDLPLTEIVPLYGRLSSAEQHRVFSPHTGRRIVLATNVAETSLTVPGIRAVVDPGTARISRFSRRTKVQRLPIEPVSQASADQRAGRCGRIGPGVCIRLYSEDELRSRPAFTEPEILRTNLASVILQMAALGLGGVESFPFLDPPDVRAVRDGVALLEELGAVDRATEGTGKWLTGIGRRMARLPVDPRLSRMVIEGDRNGCLREVLVIAAALSIQDPRDRPAGKEQHADELHRRFRHPDSDFLGWLALWDHLHGERRARTSNQFRRMCRDEYLNYRRVREWQDVHAQLRQIARDLGLSRNREPAEPEAVHRSLLTGLLSHVGTRDPEGFEYRGARGARFALSPGSALFKRSPRWVMAAELVETSRLWAHVAAVIQPEWVESAGAHLVRRSHSDPWWDPERGSAVASETVTLYGLVLAGSRTVQYGKVDPAAARTLFIRHALVQGEWDTHHGFVERNRGVVAEVEALEARQRAILMDEDAIFAFFDGRIPAGVTSVRHFDRWWRDARDVNPALLDLSAADIVDPGAVIDDTAFPPEWRYGDLGLPLRYEFDPGTERDGVTVVVPRWALDRLDPAVFEWQVPGLREELAIALTRTLPKRHRRGLVPIPDTVRGILADVDPESGALTEVLRSRLGRLVGEAIPPDAFGTVPAHLRMRFAVTDDDGRTVAEGPDLGELRDALRQEARQVASGGHEVERSGLTAWDFGELPRVVTVGEAGHRLDAYPALVAGSGSVSIRLLATRAEQAEAMWAGTIELLRLGLPAAGSVVRPTERVRRAVAAGPYGSVSAWAEDCVAAALDAILDGAGGPVWDATAFDRLVARTKDELADRVDEIVSRSVDVFEALDAVGVASVPLTNAIFAPAVADVQNQVDRLLFPGCVAAVGSGRLCDIHRYLQAIEIRLTKLRGDVERDRRLMERVLPLEDELDRLSDRLPWSPDMVEAAWMIQELRVSLFAQVLGTRRTVSEKRIRQVLAVIAEGRPPGDASLRGRR